MIKIILIRIFKNFKRLSEKLSNQFKKYIITGLLAFSFEYLTFYLLLLSLFEIY